jgi:cell division protein FtsL
MAIITMTIISAKKEKNFFSGDKWFYAMVVDIILYLAIYDIVIKMIS